MKRLEDFDWESGLKGVVKLECVLKSRKNLEQKVGSNPWARRYQSL